MHINFSFLRVSIFFFLACFSQAAVAESCSFFDTKIRFSKDEKFCINSKSLFFNHRGLIPGESRTYLEVIKSSRSYSVAVSTDPMMCPFVTGIAFDWGGVVDAQKAIEFCQKKLNVSKSAVCGCETLLDSGISLLNREQFDKRVALLERQILGSRLALSPPEEVRGSELRTEENARVDLSITEERQRLAQERQRLLEKEKLLESERLQRAQAKPSSKIEIEVSASKPSETGDFVITINTGADTASLKIDGEEQGGRKDGTYSVNRLARVGQDNTYIVIARDVYGNTDTKKITVTRKPLESAVVSAKLNPSNIKLQPAREAVAIIIGIANYKNLPKAEFASDDARAFYDYAQRALGVRPENIKLLVDGDADEIEIIRAFMSWLPTRAKRNVTDVYVFYSGHGLPADDGKSLYLLPVRVDRDFLSRTAILQSELNIYLEKVKPKSVTIFLDSCYSGLARTGEPLLANARPVSLKAVESAFPLNFTVISASQFDQISSSSLELGHGIFSYYLMRGMEGEADGNKDGKITAGEMQEYLSDKVSRQAMSINRKQDTQLVGDPSRVLVGR